MKTLHLTLKKKWFDMILSGEKKEEYREIKPYWVSRFIEWSAYPEEEKDEHRKNAENIWYDLVENKASLEDVLNGYYATVNIFDAITFKNGYQKNAPEMTVEFKGIELGTAKPEWSDNWQGDVFKILLGEILETKNLSK